MPTRAAPGFDEKMFKTVVAALDLLLPNPKRCRGDAVGPIGFAHIEQSLPQEPLVRHPDGAVPVAVRAVIGRRLIHRREAQWCPQVFRGEQMGEQSLFLLRRADSGHKWRGAIKSLIEILTAGMP